MDIITFDEALSLYYIVVCIKAQRFILTRKVSEVWSFVLMDKQDVISFQTSCPQSDSFSHREEETGLYSKGWAISRDSWRSDTRLNTGWDLSLVLRPYL